jgi:hypothetical protein
MKEHDRSPGSMGLAYTCIKRKSESRFKSAQFLRGSTSDLKIDLKRIGLMTIPPARIWPRWPAISPRKQNQCAVYFRERTSISGRTSPVTGRDKAPSTIN